MRILKFFLSILLILLGVFLIGGFFIPSEWVVSRSTTVNASAEQIYPFISNFKEWEKWSPWNAHKDATLQYTYEGPEAGAGSKQSWKSKKMGQGWMQFTSADPQKGVAYDLYMDMGRWQSTLHGIISFSSEGDNTKVTWTDAGNSGKSFIKRWMSFVFKPMLVKDMDLGLVNLKDLAEKR